jgi:hypothetical protein
MEQVGEVAIQFMGGIWSVTFLYRRYGQKWDTVRIE